MVWTPKSADEPEALPRLTIYTDGCHSKHSGLGASAVVVHDHMSGVLHVAAVPLSDATTSRAELFAAVLATKFVHKRIKETGVMHETKAWTDSEMVRKGLGEWVTSWQAKGWLLASGEPVKNQDLWKEITATPTWGTVMWSWVKGHSGVLGNELCDFLAARARQVLVHELAGTPPSYEISGTADAWAKDFLIHHEALDYFEDVQLL